jgi:hypothetical protein
MPERVGSVVSTTVTVNEPESESPPESVTEQVTVWGPPSAKKLGEAALQLGVSAPSSSSLALAEKLTFAPPIVLPSTVMLAGRVKEGLVLETGAASTVIGIETLLLYVELAVPVEFEVMFAVTVPLTAEADARNATS